MSGEKEPIPLALGPEDLDSWATRPLDYDELRNIISRHLGAHLPILIDHAVATAVEPIARHLTENLREALIARLTEDSGALIDDMLDELREKRKG